MVTLDEAKAIALKKINETDLLRVNGAVITRAFIGPNVYLFSMETAKGIQLSEYIAVNKESGEIDYQSAVYFCLDYEGVHFDTVEFKS